MWEPWGVIPRGLTETSEFGLTCLRRPSETGEEDGLGDGQRILLSAYVERVSHRAILKKCVLVVARWVATLTITLYSSAESCRFKLESSRSWFGLKILVIWHGTGAYHGVFIPET